MVNMAARFSGLYTRQAAAYARYRPKYPASLYEEIARYAAAHGTCSKELAADIACGSGQATVDIAKTYARVIGIDANAEQMSKASRAPNISFQKSTAEATGLPDASCDLVTVAQALHWFDLRAFSAEAARILKPRGTLAIWTYSVRPPSLPGGDAATNAALAAAFLRTYEGVLGRFGDPRRRLAMDDLYAGMEPPAPDGVRTVSTARADVSTAESPTTTASAASASAAASPAVWRHVERHLPVMQSDVPLSAVCEYVTSSSAYAAFMNRTGGTGSATIGNADPAITLRHDLLAAVKPGAGGDGSPSAVVAAARGPALLLDEDTMAAEAKEAAEAITLRMTWPMALILATRA